MEQIAINILPKGAKPVCHSSQFDDGRQIRFKLFNDDTPYTLSGTETISVLVHKPDDSEVVDSVTNTSDSYVIWDVSTDACELSGVCECELSIVKNGILLGSKNFTMKVEEDAYGGKNIEVRTASGRIATFSTNMVEAFKSLKSDINPVQDLHGYSKPWSGGAGKNKLNYDAWKTLTSVARGTAVFENNGVKITATGNDAYTDFSNTGFPVNARVPVTEGETITLSWQETTNASGTVMIFPNGQPSGYVFVDNAVAKKISYTVPSGVTYISFRFGVANSGDTIAYKNIQIEKGSQATAYEPYSNICPISGFTSANIVRCGVNLFDGVMESGQINANTGGNSPNASRMRTTNYIQLVANQAYYCKSSSSCYVYFYDKDKTYLGYVAGSIANLVFTPKNMVNALTGGGRFDNAVYMRMRFDNSTFNVGDLYINYPSTDTAYHAYNGQTAKVNFGQTVYGGVADVTNGKVTITHGIVDLGSLNWTKDTTTLSVTVFRANIGDRKGGSTDFICTNYEALSGDRGLLVNNNNAIATWNTQASQNVAIRDDNLSSGDATAFKNAMSGVMLCYELATPIEITTTPENLTAIVGQNNVYGDTNGDTEVKVEIDGEEQTLTGEIVTFNIDELEYELGAFANRIVTGNYDNIKLEVGSNNVELTGAFTGGQLTRYSRWL